MDPSVGHLNGILNNNFQKSQMPGGGACWSFDLTDTLLILRKWCGFEKPNNYYFV